MYEFPPSDVSVHGPQFGAASVIVSALFPLPDGAYVPPAARQTARPHVELQPLPVSGDALQQLRGDVDAVGVSVGVRVSAAVIVAEALLDSDGRVGDAVAVIVEDIVMVAVIVAVGVSDGVVDGVGVLEGVPAGVPVVLCVAPDADPEGVCDGVVEEDGDCVGVVVLDAVIVGVIVFEFVMVGVTLLVAVIDGVTEGDADVVGVADAVSVVDAVSDDDAVDCGVVGAAVAVADLDAGEADAVVEGSAEPDAVVVMVMVGVIVALGDGELEGVGHVSKDTCAEHDAEPPTTKAHVTFATATPGYGIAPVATTEMDGQENVYVRPPRGLVASVAPSHAVSTSSVPAGVVKKAPPAARQSPTEPPHDVDAPESDVAVQHVSLPVPALGGVAVVVCDGVACGVDVELGVGWTGQLLPALTTMTSPLLPHSVGVVAQVPGVGGKVTNETAWMAPGTDKRDGKWSWMFVPAQTLAGPLTQTVPLPSTTPRVTMESTPTAVSVAPVQGLPELSTTRTYVHASRMPPSVVRG